ncbi:MAG: sigma-70 family RNA polymerase sigma factor [Oscillospiraceae bacterium]|nr:sigma-70 family RNA polymerase sigma factor [Oscillospiraceae bacterium]
MPVNDRETVERAQGGDRSAFEELVRLHQRGVYTLALRHTGSAEDALDISQEAFLRAFKSLPAFHGTCSFSTWMYRLTLNLCIDHARKAKRAIPFSALGGGDNDGYHGVPEEIPDLRYLPETAAELSELRGALAESMGGLSEEHRAVFILRAVHELSYTEIAEILEIGEGTVKSRLSRARDSLRRELIKRGNFWPRGSS